MKRAILSLIFVGGLLTHSYAQQDPQYTMFYFNKMLYNPAYAGAKDAICGTMLGRFQWTGLPGAPNTWLVTADMPIELQDKNQLGIGITCIGDYIGFQQEQDLKIALAYRRKDVGPGHLAIGLDIGFQNKNISGATWITPNGLPASVDPGIPSGNNLNSFGFDLSAGVYYHNTNFYAGVSILHITGSRFINLNIKQARHMYFTGGYTFPIGGRSGWSLNPNAIIRTDMVTANFDVNMNAIYDINGKDGIFFGTTYRYIDAIGLDIGYTKALGKGVGMLIGYNYDINTSRLSSFNGGSHELILRFCFKPEKYFWKQWVVRHGATFNGRN